MALNYDYDEQGETWPFFLLTLLLVLLIPSTLIQFWRIIKNNDSEDEVTRKYKEINKKAGRDVVPLEELNELYTDDKIKKFRKKFDHSSKSKILNLRNLLIIIGWVIVSVLVQRISNNDAIKEAASGMFDPYELLGISTSASERDIKSAYRKLSVKFHPDKLSKDLSEKERTTMEEMYVQITKAYEALTDEAMRENFLKYGHPDGPQSTTHGIALPQFLVEGAASPLLVFAYVSLLALILPYIVSKWWSRTQSYTKKGIHVNTASYFADRLVNYKPSEVVTTNLIINWLSHAEEFQIFFPNKTPAYFEKLLLNHINRVPMDENPTDVLIKYRIVAKCHSLLYGLLDIASGFRNTDIALAALDTFKCLVQAVPHNQYSQILQLPNVNKEHFIDSTEDVYTVGKLFTFEDNKIQKMLGIEDKDQFEHTMKVASNIPVLKLLKADFIVPGEKHVTPSAMAYISVKVLVRSPKHKFIPLKKFPDETLQEPTDFDFLKDPFASMNEKPLLPYSFAPFFPSSRRNAWCCLVALQKDLKILQSPFILERLSLTNLTKDLDKRVLKELGDDFDPKDWEIGSIRIPLAQAAPPEKGDFPFRIIIKSTDYFGCDLDFTIFMHVSDMTEEEKRDESQNLLNDLDSSEDDISDDGDEDEDDSEYDSDLTDIDTDTETEESDVEDEKQNIKEDKNKPFFFQFIPSKK
ncbi:hypothetical protein TBLA_0B03730 [Henningerozyma blattae CBS 6284]|uniref:J domain-containing protein n=1 Tax=Henningerozyma blattae (strain ATCC 34711 / CBS 6284 / DSM 70876 / NBRC 10599 / NRRL Y-10934 / UCD 77-7) TaxID=1071380 RepID=I2GYL0_HENB6|nr:hypothetical protein TBLA_0B03730 [Tetrapisispora blattae CBS 6284]CCH59212.1 hypothetical protein TBLA_0B03730 [Tetrapisispora blattae CBS 6284]